MTRIVIFCAIFVLVNLAISDTHFAKDVSLMKAEMTEVDKDGSEIGRFQVTLTSFGRRGRPSSFVFEETWGIVCITEPCPLAPFLYNRTEFRVVSSNIGECGSTSYFAVEKSAPRREIGYRKRMRLIDHATRVCDDYQKYRWQMTLKVPKDQARFFQGNPEPVDGKAPRKCEENIPNICYALYAPSECEASTVDNGATAIKPLSATGGNACYATVTIKTLACRQGIEPERFLENDIQCRLITEPPVVTLEP